MFNLLSKIVTLDYNQFYRKTLSLFYFLKSLQNDMILARENKCSINFIRKSL